MLNLSGSAKGWRHIAAHLEDHINSNATRLLVILLAFFWSCYQAEMISPSLIAHTRSCGNHLYPPFHLIAIFAPPFLDGYQHRGMKEQQRKSNHLITTVVHSCYYRPCLSMATSTIMLRQQEHMSTSSHSCAGAWVFHILWVIIMKNDNQLETMVKKRQWPYLLKGKDND